MSAEIKRCDRCGAEFGEYREGRRFRVVELREKSRGVFSQDGYNRCYCAKCAALAKLALKRFEEEVA